MSVSVAAFRRLWWLRLLFVILALGAWFWSQSLIGARPTPTGALGDGLLDAFLPVSLFLQENPGYSRALLIVSSLGIDFVGVWLLGASVFGSSMRPFVALLALFVMRQICQGLCALPIPEGMIWYHPGVPSLLVTYGVSNDFFFSGHTGLAMLGAWELMRGGKAPFVALGVAFVLFEMTAVIALRAHYTMDVYTAVVVALLVSQMAERVGPKVDRAVVALYGRLGGSLKA
jgi:hypothetical protein